MGSPFFIMKTIDNFGRRNYPAKRDKEEFVYMFREEINQIPYALSYYDFCKHPAVKWIGEKAKWFFGYSPRYANIDIAYKFRQIYLKMKQEGRLS